MILLHMQIRGKSRLRRTKSYKIRRKKFRAEFNSMFLSSTLVREVSLLPIKSLIFSLVSIKMKMKQRMAKRKRSEMKARKRHRNKLNRRRKIRPK